MLLFLFRHSHTLTDMFAMPAVHRPSDTGCFVFCVRLLVSHIHCEREKSDLCFCSMRLIPAADSESKTHYQISIRIIVCEDLQQAHYIFIFLKSYFANIIILLQHLTHIYFRIHNMTSINLNFRFYCYKSYPYLHFFWTQEL